MKVQIAAGTHIGIAGAYHEKEFEIETEELI